MNYKQTELFNEKKEMVLIAMAYYNLDCDNEGVHVPIAQLKRYFGIKDKTLYRILNSLKSENYIKLGYSGYEVGKKTQKWKIQKKSSFIIYDKGKLIKFFQYININNVGYNNNNYDKYKNDDNDYKLLSPMLSPSNSFTMLSPSNLWYKDNELLHNHILGLIADIEILVNENNNFTKFFNRSSLRIITKTKRKKSFAYMSGRIYNCLCNTKANRPGKIYKRTDFRPDRKTILNIYDYTDYKEIFDIKSQIPRLTYILQGGSYNDIIDFYNIENIKREDAKDWFMYFYFGGSFEMEAWHITLKYFKNHFPNAVIQENNKIYFKEQYRIVYNHFNNLIKPIGTEIFLWASYWEQLIIKETREQYGINLLNVYDGFYYGNDNYTENILKIVIGTSEYLKIKYQDRLNIEFQGEKNENN